MGWLADRALWRAVWIGDALAAKNAMARGANPNASTLKGVTALWESCARDHLPVVQALVDAGAYVHTGLLCLACRRGYHAIADFLLDRGVDVDGEAIAAAAVWCEANEGLMARLLERATVRSVCRATSILCSAPSYARNDLWTRRLIAFLKEHEESTYHYELLLSDRREHERYQAELASKAQVWTRD